VLQQAIGNTDTLDSPRLGFGGSRHFPLYSILCASPWGPHPNGFLSQDSRVGVPKSRQMGLLWLWNPITLRVDLESKCGLKKSCSFCQELSNCMWHDSCNQVNWLDSRLFVVESQIGNLTFGPSFGHNLCFKCPNEQYEPILDIYVSRFFKWYKECYELLSFGPYNHSLNFRESTRTLSQPHFEGVVRSPLTLLKMGLGSPSGLSKTQSAIIGVKTPRIGTFLVPLERFWSVDVQNGLAWAILDVASAESCRVYYMGEGGGFPRVRAVVSLVCPSARGLSQHPRVFPNAN
jgi:hypothetical protein